MDLCRIQDPWGLPTPQTDSLEISACGFFKVEKPGLSGFGVSDL